MAYDSARQVAVLWGGYGDETTGEWELNDTWEWDGASWTERAVEGPGARIWAVMTYDAARGECVLLGGYVYGQPGTWTWDGEAWTQRAAYWGAPQSCITYDAVRQRVVYAYQGGTFGWSIREWDGQSWSAPVSGPPGWQELRHGAAVFDSQRSRSVLFVPSSSRGMQMYTWDGATVTMPEWPEQPAGRHSHAMAYDSAHAETILFGGLRRNGSGEPEFLDDETWSYDGRDWRLLTTDDPSPRAGHRMAYDTTRERVLLLGGQTDAGLSDELWAWDGSAWSLVTAGGITPRHSFAMAYDSGRDRLIAQSGELGAGEYDRYTWEYDGANWSIVSWTGPYTRYDHARAYDPVRGVTVLHGGRTI